MARQAERYIDKVGALLLEAGYRSSIDQNDPVITSAANGFTFIIIGFNDDGLQFHCSIELENPNSSLLADINGYNSRFRYMKIFYEYDEKQLVLQSDHFFDASGSSSSVIFAKMIHIYDAALTSLKELLAMHSHASEEINEP